MKVDCCQHALRLGTTARVAGPEAATNVLGTPARCATDALQVEADTPAAMPQLRSPLISPLRRTGVRGAPQRVATPAAERHVMRLHLASTCVPCARTLVSCTTASACCSFGRFSRPLRQGGSQCAGATQGWVLTPCRASHTGQCASSCHPCGLSPLRLHRPAWTARSTWRTNGRRRRPRGCSGSGQLRRAAQPQSCRPAPHGCRQLPQQGSSLPEGAETQSSRDLSLLARRHTALQHQPLLQKCCGANSRRQSPRSCSICRGSPVQTQVRCTCLWLVYTSVNLAQEYIDYICAGMHCWPREAFGVRPAMRLIGSTACRWRTAVGGDDGMQAAGRQPAPPHAAGPAATHRRPLRQVFSFADAETTWITRQIPCATADHNASHMLHW